MIKALTLILAIVLGQAHKCSNPCSFKAGDYLGLPAGGSYRKMFWTNETTGKDDCIAKCCADEWCGAWTWDPTHEASCLHLFKDTGYNLQNVASAESGCVEHECEEKCSYKKGDYLGLPAGGHYRAMFWDGEIADKAECKKLCCKDEWCGSWSWDPDHETKCVHHKVGAGVNVQYVSNAESGCVRLTKKTTAKPTKKPTKAPTKYPTKYPTMAPTKYPTVAPTKYPTMAPTKYPTVAPTKYPTLAPTLAPTDKCSEKCPGLKTGDYLGLPAGGSYLKTFWSPKDLSTVEECREECCKREECGAYTFVPGWEAGCSLLKKGTGYNLQHVTGAQSGCMRCCVVPI